MTISSVLLQVASAAAFAAAALPATAQTVTAQTVTAQTVIAIDAAANRHPISPDIYGVAFASTSDLIALNAPLNRWGGNYMSTYSYANNAQNLTFDNYYVSSACYIFEATGPCNPYQSRGSAVPGEEADTFVGLTKAAGAQPMLTIPLIGHVAKLAPDRSPLWSFPVHRYGAQCATDPSNADAGDGRQPMPAATLADCFTQAPDAVVAPGVDTASNAYVPDTLADEAVWLAHLVQRWGQAPDGVPYYFMDNEASVWHATHRDIHPVGLHASEYRDKVIQAAALIRGIDPAAKIVAPEEWGWGALPYSGYDQQNASSLGWDPRSFVDLNAPGQQNGMFYLPWLLTQWKPTHAVDVVSLHYYPQSGEFSFDDACADTNPATPPVADSPAMQAMRNRSTRELWDPGYVSPTWIAMAPYLIPRMRAVIDAYYVPGTPFAITEYNWGDENCMNGATAQADLLGIFGAQGLDMATRWATPAPTTPTYKVLQLYRNYDGNDSGFGQTSVAASVPDPDTLSAFAAIRADGALTVMVINKVAADTPLSLSLANFTSAGAAARYRVSPAAPATIQQPGVIAISNGVLSDTAPAQSVTLYVMAMQ